MDTISWWVRFLVLHSSTGIGIAVAGIALGIGLSEVGKGLARLGVTKSGGQ